MADYLLLETFFIQAFVTLFGVMDPVGTVPVFLSMTQTHTHSERVRLAKRAALTVFVVMLLFLFSGKFILYIFGVSFSSFKIAGGLILLMIGIRMVDGRPLYYGAGKPSSPGAMEDIAVVPIAIPLLSGPGALSTVVIFAEQALDWEMNIALVMAVLINSALIYFFLSRSSGLLEFIRSSWLKIMVRLVGLIVVAVAVEFIFSGAKKIIFS